MGTALSMVVGDYKQFSLTFTKGGLPVDLTSVEQIAYTLLYPSGSPFAQWSLTGGQIVVDSPPVAGIATLTVTPAMLAAALFPNGIPQELTLLGIASLIDAVGNPTLRSGSSSFQLLLPPTPPVIA
jgi:hypothetical protein